MPDMILIDKELFALWEPSASAIWALCGARLLGMMLTVPFFSSRLLPLRFRGALIALLVFVLLSGASTPWRDQVASLLREGTTPMLALFASEVLIGMAPVGSSSTSTNQMQPCRGSPRSALKARAAAPRGSE